MDVAIGWLPAAAVVLLTLVGLAAARGRPGSMAAVLVVGGLAIAAAVWRQQQTAPDLGVGGLAARLAETTGEPPPAQPDAAATIRRAAARLAELSASVKELTAQVKQQEQKVASLQKAGHNRTIAEATGEKLADYLRGFGSHRVVVSCIPDDLEAFGYATQIVDVLKRANWDAHGPETTKIFGPQPAIAISVYSNGAQLPEAAKILADAFRKFDVPYQPKIGSSELNPDPETAELFVPPKP